MTLVAPNLSTDARAIRVRKRRTRVTVEFADREGSCATLEGKVRYRAGDAILRGVECEQWPIKRELFLKRYQPEPPTKKGEEGVYVSRSADALAVQLDQPARVLVGPEEDALVGNVGDWLIEYAHGGYGIVSESIFSSTYRILEPEPAN